MDILGCKAGALPTKYLGLPLCVGNANKSVWSPVIERVEKKLSSWKANYLFSVGRVTLVKSALSNLPVHFMSI